MELLLYGVAILLSSIASVAGSAPNISPAGYNASLNEDEVVDFRCTVTRDTISVVWFINGTSAAQLGQEALAVRGITQSITLITEDNSTFVVIKVQARAENDYTTLECLATSPDYVTVKSEEVLFRVQGLLDPPTGLMTAYLDFAHDALMWEDPYTLDLTGPGPDITGYTVTVIMEHPPPLFPYDHSVTLAELAATSSRTFNVSSGEDQQRFPFLRYAFPVWLGVSAENAAGLGDMSQYHKYTNQPQSDCMRISDSVVSKPANKVTFVNSTSYLEIILFQLPSEMTGAKYCFDTVVVIVSDGDGAVSPSHTLVPRLSGNEVSVELDSGQEQDTHFTASLFFNSQLIATTDFSTYDVQDVSISPLPNGLMVQCVFAGGSTDDMCRVVLVLDEEVVMMKDVVRGVGGEFSNLATGTYTVLVYDSGADMEGSGEEWPAVETIVNVTGEAPSPTTDSPTTATGATDPSSSPTSGPTDDESDSGSSGGIGTSTLYIVIAIAVVCVSVLVLIAALIAFKRYRNKASNYSVKKRESRISGSNPLHDISELEMKDPGYSEIPAGTGPRPSSMVAIGMESVAEDAGYEVVDADKARERRAKKMEKKTEAVPGPVASVYTEEEIKELRRHTYSTVNKDKSVKRKTVRQDSSPPPVPPQTFDTQYAEELLRDGQSLEEQVKIDLATEDHDSHIYDSLHPTTTSPVGSPFHSNGVQPSPPHLPPKHVSQVVAGPMYDSIKSPPLLVPVHSPHQPSPTPSPTDDRDNSRLLQASPPQLPPKTSTVPHVDPMYESIKSTPSKSRPAISRAHFGSNHSVTNDVAAGGPALRHGRVGTASSFQRPHSMLVPQSSADTHSAMLSAAAGFSLDRRMTRRMSSLPLLTSNLQHDV